MALFTKAFGKRKPIKVHFPSARGKYIRFRMKDPKAFAKGSFRTIRAGRRGTKLVIGCPKGQYAKMDGWRCKVGTRTQAVLVPKWRAKAERLRAVANPKRIPIEKQWATVSGITFEGREIKSPPIQGHRKLMKWLDKRSPKGGSYTIKDVKRKNPLLMLAQNKEKWVVDWKDFKKHLNRIDGVRAKEKWGEHGYLIGIKEEKYKDAIRQLLYISSLTDIAIGFDYNTKEYTLLAKPRLRTLGKNPLLMLAQNRLKSGSSMKYTGKYSWLPIHTGDKPSTKSQLIRKFKRTHQKTFHRNPFWWKKKGFSKNPLLMVAGNPSDNPRPCPFKKGQKIPIAKFESWLYKNGNPDEIKRYGKSKIGYKKFHLGANPTFITRELIDVGNPKTITDRDFSYTAGKSPHEVYQTPKGSGKQRISRVGFIHKWKNRPETIVSGNKTIIKQLKGQAKITDWMRG